MSPVGEPSGSESASGERLLLRAVFSRATRRIVAHTTEVGEQFAFVRTDEDLSIGEGLRLELSFPRLLPPVEVDATVVAKELGSGPGYLAGVRVAFANSTGDRLERFSRLLAGPSEPDAAAGPSSWRRILVVEDSAVIREFVEVGASRFFDPGRTRVSLDTAESAEDAWVLVERERYDLALVDLYLPGAKTGADLVRHIRAQDGLEDLPVVGFSVGGKAARDEFFAAGADLFLEKPVMVRDLFGTLERLALMNDQKVTA
jgi:CheY-like chemotaxis protein